MIGAYEFAIGSSSELERFRDEFRLTCSMALQVLTAADCQSFAKGLLSGLACKFFQVESINSHARQFSSEITPSDSGLRGAVPSL